jgi:hypothetical protein
VSAKYGLAKKGVIVAGYDLYPQTLGYINTGDATFTTDQQPYLQGFVPILQMYLYKLSGGAVAPADTNTSLAYVTWLAGKSRRLGNGNDYDTDRNFVSSCNRPKKGCFHRRPRDMDLRTTGH